MRKIKEKRRRMSGARREEERDEEKVLVEQQKVLVEQRNVLVELQKVLVEQRNVLVEQQKVLVEQQKVVVEQLKITGQKKNKEQLEQNSSLADSAMLPCEDPWKIKKVLGDFDVTLRLRVPSLMARNFMLPMLNATDYEIEKGIDVEIWDVDTQTSHYLFFIKKSHDYMFMDSWKNDFLFGKGLCLHKVDNWINEFVLRRRLHKGDEIGLYWDTCNNRFNFSLLRRFNFSLRHHLG